MPDSPEGWLLYFQKSGTLRPLHSENDGCFLDLSASPKVMPLGSFSRLGSGAGNGLEHVGSNLRQPLWLDGCDVLHLVPAAGPLLDCVENQHAGSDPPQDRRLVDPEPDSCKPHRGHQHHALSSFCAGQ